MVTIVLELTVPDVTVNVKVPIFVALSIDTEAAPNVPPVPVIE
jgi:hypothetical protein